MRQTWSNLSLNIQGHVEVPKSKFFLAKTRFSLFNFCLLDSLVTNLCWLPVSFHPALFFLCFEQNSSLHAYSGQNADLFFVKIPPCTLIWACTHIRVTRVALEYDCTLTLMASTAVCMSIFGTTLMFK